MDSRKLKNHIQSLALHFGEVVKCEWLDTDSDKWESTKMKIDIHFLSEFEKGNIRRISYNKTGVELIMFERERQVSEEGWIDTHDDVVNSDEELAEAAALYALPEERRAYEYDVNNLWPWSRQWWKPTPGDRIKELTKAGALIAAEIDRLQRLNKEREQIDKLEKLKFEL